MIFQIKIGLNYFSAEKNKDLRIILAANFESLEDTVKDRINHTSLDFFPRVSAWLYRYCLDKNYNSF